jgi:plastocyanin
VAEQQVVIDNFAFSPRELTVALGTRVTWVNRDDVPHTATSSVKPRTFDSGALDTDNTFPFVFKTPGTYDYFCAVHPHMTGKVIVK